MKYFCHYLRAACLAHLNLPDSIAVTLVGEEYKLRDSLLLVFFVPRSLVCAKCRCFPRLYYTYVSCLLFRYSDKQNFRSIKSTDRTAVNGVKLFGENFL